VHQRDVAVSELVQADRLEVPGLAVKERADRGGCPSPKRSLADVGRRERHRSGPTEHEVGALAAGVELVLEQVSPERGRNRHTATTLARLLASSPDRSLRDGRRAYELALAVYTTSPTPVHRETVAMALAELGRCDEALEWMQRAVAEAAQANDADATRLKGEISKYESASCRPPWQ